MGWGVGEENSNKETFLLKTQVNVALTLELTVTCHRYMEGGTEKTKTSKTQLFCPKGNKGGQ